MTKKIGPEQEEHLKALGVARNKLQRVRKTEADAMKEVHALIRGGFDIGISGLKLAQYSGLSQPRVYQVRDEIIEETTVDHTDADEETPTEAAATAGD